MNKMNKYTFNSSFSSFSASWFKNENEQLLNEELYFLGFPKNKK